MKLIVACVVVSAVVGLASGFLGARLFVGAFLRVFLDYMNKERR